MFLVSSKCDFSVGISELNISASILCKVIV